MVNYVLLFQLYVCDLCRYIVFFNNYDKSKLSIYLPTWLWSDAHRYRNTLYVGNTRFYTFQCRFSKSVSIFHNILV